MIRTYGHEEVIELAQYASVPVINGSPICSIRARFWRICSRPMKRKEY